MRKTLLAGLALISLAACGGGAKKSPAVAQVKPPAVKPTATKPKARKATAPAHKATTPARKSTRRTPAPADTTTPRNPLLNH